MPPGSSVLRTKQSIYQAVGILLKVQSFSTISVTQIAEIAGISRNSFYKYYHDKYAFLEEVLSSFDVSCKQSCRYRNWKPVLEFLETNSSLLCLLLQDKQDTRFKEAFKDHAITQFSKMEAAAGIGNSHLFVYRGLLEGLYGMIEWWLLHESHSNHNQAQLLQALEQFVFQIEHVAGCKFC